MKTSRFGGLLLATGAAVGVAAVIGLVTGFEPSRLPAALIDIAVYKLTFVAAAGLLAAGAVIRRRGRRDDADGKEARQLESPHVKSGAPRLPDSPPADFAPKREQRTDLRIPKE